MPKTTVTRDDKPAVKGRLAAARERLRAACEASDKRKARAARRGIRLAKRELRAFARMPELPSAEEEKAE
jgi:hypothetical protein